MNFLARTVARLFVVASLALTAGYAAAQQADAAMTEKVLGMHLKAFGEGDVDAIMADYADGAILITPDGTLRGHDQIRPLFEGMVAEFAKPGASFEMGKQIIEGDIAYIVWSAETADNVYEVASDTFVIKDGKIVAQTLAGKITPK